MIKNIIKLITGLSVSLSFALVVYSISYVYLLNTGIQKNESRFELYVLLLSLVALITLLIIWLKSRTYKVMIISLFALAISYILGKIYTTNLAKPYFQVMKLIAEAEGSVKKDWLAETSNKNKYLDGEKNMLLCMSKH